MKKSKGHIAFVNDNEYFVGTDGEVYRAQLSDAFDVKSKNRIGRWECSLDHALHYAKVLGLKTSDVKKAAKKAKLKESVTVKIKKSQLKGLIREVLLEAEQASVFDINTVDKFMDDLKKGLRYFPFLKLSKSTLGGDKNVSVTVHLSLDKKEDWNNNIYHNSRYIIFHFSNQGVLKSGATFSGKNAKASFRKSRFKDAKGAIAKIKQWHDKNKNNPNKW